MAILTVSLTGTGIDPILCQGYLPRWGPETESSLRRWLLGHPGLHTVGTQQLWQNKRASDPVVLVVGTESLCSGHVDLWKALKTQ